MQDDAEREDKIREKFEKFTASASWRALPLQIKLLVVHLWRRERDVPSQEK
jgi:hypothetical protein